MRRTPYKIYNFATAEQWRAGLAHQLTPTADGLIAAARRDFDFLSGSDAKDADARLAIDPASDLYWLRPTTYELMRATPGGHYRVLDFDLERHNNQPLDLAVGVDNVWLRVLPHKRPPRVLRYHKETGRSLAGVESDRRILAMSSDGRDGVWLLLGGDCARATLDHFDANGLRIRSIPLPADLECAQLAVGSDRDTVVVLDLDPQTDPCTNPAAWRLWAIYGAGPCSHCAPQVQTLYTQLTKDCACRPDTPGFFPSQLALDEHNRIHLLAGEIDQQPAPAEVDKTTSNQNTSDQIPSHQTKSEEDYSGDLWSLDLPPTPPGDNAASVIAKVKAAVPPACLPVAELAARPGERAALIVSGGFGLAQLAEQSTAQAVPGDDLPAYLSPLLVSPEGDQKGWQRVDLDAVLDASSALEISVAATDDQAVLRQVRDLVDDTRRVPADVLRRLDALLPWQPQFTRVYRGSDWPAGRRIRFPLQEVQQRHLWLKLRLLPAPGGAVTRIERMQVLYPNISYTRFLPAIYQQDPLGRRLLRGFLVGLESVLGDLNQHIAELPDNIDPNTAPADWLPFLLRWLGLPAATELSPDEQRELLIEAPTLLRQRGTLPGLQRLLTTLVGRDNYSIRDSGARPAPWLLPAESSAPAAARLGRDTLIGATEPAADDGSGDEEALGALFNNNARFIEIRVAVAPQQQQAIEDLLSRYLPYFIPAQCRYRLYMVTPPALERDVILNDDLRLREAPKARLGIHTRLGDFALPAGAPPNLGIIVGRSHLGGGLYFPGGAD